MEKEIEREQKQKSLATFTKKEYEALQVYREFRNGESIEILAKKYHRSITGIATKIGYFQEKYRYWKKIVEENDFPEITQFIKKERLLVLNYQQSYPQTLFETYQSKSKQCL